MERYSPSILLSVGASEKILNCVNYLQRFIFALLICLSCFKKVLTGNCFDSCYMGQKVIKILISEFFVTFGAMNESEHGDLNVGFS